MSKIGSKDSRLLAVALAAMAIPTQANAQRTFSFAYDQPNTTAYGIAANLFDAKLKEVSGGKMSINQFPGAQLGQEPVMLQKLRAGDIDFVITSTANASTLAPQAGVFSLHFIFRDKDHLAKTLADPGVSKAFRDMVKESVQGAQVLGLLTMGMRNIYSKKEIKSVDDLKGQKIRVQATKTEDTHFPAYGTQTVHMPFGEVYTSLQTGVVNAAENGINVYLANKHYEVAPVLSITEHEANNNCIWVSDKTWNSLSDQEKGWVQAAADEVSKKEPAMALKLEVRFRGQAQDHGRQGRRRRRQVRLHESRGSDPGPARQGTRPARGQDPRTCPQREIRKSQSGGGASSAAVFMRWGIVVAAVTDFAANKALVLQRHRHLKWPWLDWLEKTLMILCGVCLGGFTLCVLCDVVTRETRLSVAVAATGDHGVLRLGRVHRHRRRHAPQRSHLSGRDHQGHDRHQAHRHRNPQPCWSCWSSPESSCGSATRMRSWISAATACPRSSRSPSIPASCRSPARW